MRKHLRFAALTIIAALILCADWPGLSGRLAARAEANPDAYLVTQVDDDAYADPDAIPLDSTENVIAACQAVYEEYRAGIEDRRDELTDGQITMGEITMRVDLQVIGEPDANGYPTIIALHGGGSSDTPDSNDGQWEQMKYYYREAVTAGLYLTPRGIRDTWDTHFNPESYAFYDRMIEDAVAFNNADPDRVYLLGFSAGGDGVYGVSTRMPDRFAAVNMSAGHPNGVSILNLYQLPIILQVGELDDAYSRNTVTAEYDALLGQTAEEYGGGYVHTTLVHLGMGHNFYDDDLNRHEVAADVQAWLKTGNGGKKTVETNAVRLTGAYTRQANPDRVVWDVGTNAPERGVTSFYWLGREDGLDTGVIVAGIDRETNRVTVESCTAEQGTLKIYLTAAMADLFAPVTVDFCGVESEVAIAPSLEIMRETAAERGDPEMVYAAVIRVDVATGEVFP